MKLKRLVRTPWLSQIIKLVEDAQQTKAPIAKIADQVSAVFVPVVMAIALVSGLFWYFVMGQTFTFAMTVAVSVLVIACPCALGLATPTASWLVQALVLNTVFSTSVEMCLS